MSDVNKNFEDENKNLDVRRKQANNIISDPQKYKICLGCESIIRRTTSQGSYVGICPMCHSYRFEENPLKIRKHAEKLGKSEKQSVSKEDLE